MKKNSKGIILPSGSENFIDEYIKTLNERQLELNADYPQLNDNDIKQIKKIIFSFRGNLLMKHNMIKLCKYMGPENLLYGVLNLGDLKIKKKLQYYRYNGDIIAVDGSYSASDNELIYFRNKDMPHELIHMCSTPKNYALYQKTGFGYILNSEKKNAGLNEGYTELLARRIFFRGNYNTNCYSRNVYLMRLFELLYDDARKMEKDYFKANHQSPIDTFLEYGSKDELEAVIKFLDVYDYTTRDSDVITAFDGMIEIIGRKSIDDKIFAEEIAEEYYKNKNICKNKVLLK